MAITRVTQNMMADRSVGSLQQGLVRLSRIQEQLSTGRVLNRPSDSPTDTTSAMRIRSALADVTQHGRNAADGVGWLTQVDAALDAANNQVLRARDVALQGANEGSVGPAARQALAEEIDQIAAGLVNTSNAKYLDRPVFGGVTAGPIAYDAAGNFVGVPAPVSRTVADGVRVRVDVDGPSAFGPAGGSAFEHLTALATALRAGDQAGISAAISDLNADSDRLVSVRAEAGTRMARVQDAQQSAEDRKLALSTQLSDIENVDLPRTIVDLQLQQVAYQSALAATSKVMQPSLLDFLR